ncbi:MAG: GNAT family N-acetyltransferase [Cypionkella sp.]|uniref:GNAT family N-acetyltransferase n=1 Tax=Cypionkella sp. TaxID=2811411 RepID=UPI002ABBC877|nr:GNAT family N-acetyltransferase [Cypionkella sp.]MDZ4309828.1 GNAT family N-acetyltransferase [Cypionkella sp.]
MIEITPEAALTATDETQIATLLARCFDTPFSNRSYYRQRPHLRLIHRQHGQIIGHIGLLLHGIRLGGTLTEIAGLVEVATHPAHRGQAIASTLLRAAITQAHATQAEYLLLFGEAALYAGHGFTRHTNILTYLDITETRTRDILTEPAQTLMVLPLRGQIWPTSAPLDMLGPLF